MIYTTVNLTIDDYESTADHNIILYRGDKNVEVRFVLVNNKFIVKDCTYAQLIIKRPSAPSIFSEVSSVENNTVVLVITQEMIDELGEIGEYSFQIRLYDDNMNARVTLPPCISGLIINEPIVIEEQVAINVARVNYGAIKAYSGEEDAEGIFDEDGNYIKTEWMDGDIITDVKMNKIESALYEINANGGGGGAGSSPYISSTLSENVTVETGQDFDLYLDFSSPNLGKGTLKVFINDVDALTVSIPQGENTVTVSSSLLSKGTNKMVIYILDRTGAMSNSLTFYIRYGGTELVSTFDPYTAYDYGAVVRYYFTPTALDTSLPLTFYMEIDGVTQEGISCTSDVRSYYTFPSRLTVGNHYCRAWVFDGTTNSNVLTFNLIILDENSLVVASDTLSPSVEEGAQLVLDYKVYMKNNTSFITKTYIDETLVNTGTCTLETAYFRTSSLTEGTHTVKVVVFDVTETYSDYVTWTVNVTPSTYEMKQPINAGSLFIASALNKTNSDETREMWIGKNQDGEEIPATLENFAFNSESGWVDDTLVISGKSWVEVPIAPLANNAKYGFTLDIEFSTKPIGVEDAEVLTLWNETDNCGIKITTEQLIMRSKSGNQCDLYFGENEVVSAIFVIDRDEKTAKIYLNGVMCEAFALSDYVAAGVSYLEDFTVDSNIYLGGYDKNGYSVIKNLRVYEVALATDEIINNFICNETDKSTQRQLVEFQKGDTLPTLTVYCDFSGLGKDDKKPCDIVYNSPDVVKYGESFALYGKHSMLQYQGTSSMQYPIKNYRLNPRDENGKVKLDPFNNGVAESRFTLKADFMSSGHWQNTGLAKWVNDCLYNYNVNDEKSMNARKWYDVQNGGSVKDTREAINGFPCRLILVNDGETPLNEGQQEPTPGNTKDMGIFNFNNDKDNTDTLGFDTDIFPNCMSFEVTANSDTSAGAFVPYTLSDIPELEYLQNSFELRFPDEDDYGSDYGFLNVNGDTSMGLKRVIDWVGNATDEQFVEEFEQYFHKDYTLRYYLLVITLGMVDNLGKNMMFDTFDGKIWHPRFYDMDTICSYDNSGEIKFDVDIEMEQGYWNTSASRLWTKIRDLMHDDLVEKYNNMRQNGMSYESFMSYFYDKQIAQIPQTYYNKDYDVKYAPYADEYMGKAHGDGYEHLKRWLKRRLIFTDTLFDYAPSYTNDALTIRANTLDLMSLEIETYTPVYQHVSFYNGNMEKIKIDGKTSTIFTGTAQTATDQEVLIYGGSNIKRIKGISSMNPNSMLIGNATRLVELDVANCPLLTVVNSNKANFSPHEYLNKLDISGCSQLGGTLRLNNSPLIQEINAKGTIVDNLLLPTSIRNLTTLRLPSTVTALALNDASLLSTLEFEENNNLQSVSMTNCNNLTECINFDLTQIPTVSLNNSYNITNELYMSKTTNLSLKNMSELERLIYIPNNEYETFTLDTLKNSGDYKIDTFNCPKLTDFITTAPHRLSYNNGVGLIDKEIVTSEGSLVEKTISCNLRVTNGFDTTTGAIKEGTGGMSDDEYYHITNGYQYTVNTTGSWLYIAKYDENKKFLGAIYSGYNSVNDNHSFTADSDYYIRVCAVGTDITITITGTFKENNVEIIQVKDYGDIKPNTVFTANSLDLRDTQFTNIKLLCTTDLYKLMLPTTVKNFYCDSSFDIDTDVITNAEYDIIHNEFIEPYTTDYSNEVLLSRSGQFTNTFEFVNDILRETVYIEVFGGSEIYLESCNLYSPYDTMLCLREYDENKTQIKETKTWGHYWTKDYVVTLQNNTKYVTFFYTKQNDSNSVTPTYYTRMDSVPNIIPSSSDGSLIFSMYAPKLVDEPTSGVWDLYGLELNDFHTFGMNNDVKPTYDENNEITSITMPCRYSPYKVQIQNANITPINYNTMLYPLLVDTALPITGHLDYSQYTGTYLSWAYAYTTDDVIINPLGSQEIANIKYDYNKLYSTDYVDIVDIWVYADTDVSTLIENTNITKAYIELTSENYRTRLVDVAPYYPNCTDVYLFDDGTVTTLNDFLNSKTVPFKNFTFVNGYFENCTSMVNAFNQALNTETVTNLPNNVKNMERCFYLTSALKSISNFPSEVTNLNYCFYGQKNNLVEVPELPKSVVSMHNAFTNCRVLNQQFDLSEHNNIGDLSSAFQECKGLTIIPILPTNYEGSLNSTFYGCSKLTTPPTIPEGVTNMTSTFQGCTSLTTAPIIPEGVTNMASCFNSCSSLNKAISEMISVVQSDILNDFKASYGIQVTEGETIVITTTKPITEFKYQYLNSNYDSMGESEILTLTNSLQLTIPTTGASIIRLYWKGDCKLTVVKTKNKTPTIPNSVTNMDNTFQNCASLIAVPVIPSGVTSLKGTFQNCSSLTNIAIAIPSTCTTIMYLFDGCNQLKSIDFNGSDTTKLSSTSYAFRGTGLETLNLSMWNVSKVISMNNMFYNSAISSINFGNWNTDLVSNINQMYYGCSNLTNALIPLTSTVNKFNSSLQFTNPNVDIEWSGTLTTLFSLVTLANESVNFSEEDIKDLVNNHLGTVESETLTLGETYLAYLTEEEIASAVAKGWVLQ